MTNQLKYTAQECKDIRGLPPAWYDFDTLAITYGIGHTDAMFIAAASPDAVLALIAERDALKAENERLRDLMKEAASNCKASIAEDGISDSRRVYRAELLHRLNAAMKGQP